MTDTKNWYESKSVWGGAVALAALGVSLLHHTFSPADQATAVEILTEMGGAIGSLVAIYGRIVASKQIGS